MTSARPLLRVGVAGVGSLGFHHARILAGLPGVAMAGVHDVRPERAAEVSRELGVRAHAELDSLLDGIDALVVAVPTTVHEPVAVAALERGIAVLVEKPMAPTLDAADRILAAARATGALVQIGHVERFNSAIVAAEPYLDTPLFVESHRLAPFSPRSIDVAVVLDLMIHDVDLVRSLVGAPVREIAAVGVPVLTQTADIANARLVFESGAVANLTASRISLEKMRKIRIFQRSGYLSLNLAEGTGEFLRLKGDLPALGGAAAGSWMSGVMEMARLVERIPLKGDKVEPLRRELESFRDAVQGVRPPVVTGEEGRAAHEVTLSIQERIQRTVEDAWATAGSSPTFPEASRR
jgi:predicted dehydrogenase